MSMCWGDFLFVFIVFGLIWFVIFKGRMGSRFYGYGMVERKCICVSGVFSMMLNNIKYIRSFIMPTVYLFNLFCSYDLHLHTNVYLVLYFFISLIER